MIYIILEPRFKSSVSKNDLVEYINFETEPCIKIGYSENFATRLSMYETDTPRVDVAFTYEDGTEDDEKRLHKYFEKYKSEDLNGNEWFILNKEFMDFFKSCPTIEDIRAKISHIILPRDKIRLDKAEKLILSIVYLLVDLGIDNNSVSFDDISYLEKSFQYVIKTNRLLDYYFEKIKPETVEEFLDFLKNELTKEDHELLVKSYQELLSKNIDIDISKELETFNSINFYHDKMRYLCDQNLVLPKDKFNMLLNSVPKSFKNYYITLGPDRCKALKYQKGEMEREYQRLLNNQRVVSLDDRIYNTFHAGDRIRKSEIKVMLKKIYQDSGFQQTARAKDLERWFTLKEIQIRIKGTNMKDHGFELLSRTIPPTINP